MAGMGQKLPSLQRAISSLLLPSHIKAAAVTVDPNDALLNAILARFTPDFIQLHGKETLKRVGEIKERFGHPTRCDERIRAAGGSPFDSTAKRRATPRCWAATP
jgi:phosphoribosylanthranilate isomerase